MSQIDEEFGDWYGTITSEPFLGTAAWGESFGDPVSIPAFWDSNNRVVTTSDGKTVTSDVKLYCGVQWRESLTEGARIRIPEDSRVYRVAQVRGWPGEDTHLEVNLS